MLPCPPNAMIGTYDLPVRHCIDFSGVKDVTRVKIPDALTRFREFKFNDKLLRISYMTARLTYCATRASFFKDGIFYKKGDFISLDPNKDEFNRIFVEANKNLSYYDYSNPSKPFEVKTYDFLDKGDERSGLINAAMQYKAAGNDIAKNFGNIVKVVVAGVVVIVLVKTYQNLSIKR